MSVIAALIMLLSGQPDSGVHPQSGDNGHPPTLPF